MSALQEFINWTPEEFVTRSGLTCLSFKAVPFCDVPSSLIFRRQCAEDVFDLIDQAVMNAKETWNQYRQRTSNQPATVNWSYVSVSSVETRALLFVGNPGIGKTSSLVPDTVRRYVSKGLPVYYHPKQQTCFRIENKIVSVAPPACGTPAAPAVYICDDKAPITTSQMEHTVTVVFTSPRIETDEMKAFRKHFTADVFVLPVLSVAEMKEMRVAIDSRLSEPQMMDLIDVLGCNARRVFGVGAYANMVNAMKHAATCLTLEQVNGALVGQVDSSILPHKLFDLSVRPPVYHGQSPLDSALRFCAPTSLYASRLLACRTELLRRVMMRNIVQCVTPATASFCGYVLEALLGQLLTTESVTFRLRRLGSVQDHVSKQRQQSSKNNQPCKRPAPLTKLSLAKKQILYFESVDNIVVQDGYVVFRDQRVHVSTVMLWPRLKNLETVDLFVPEGVIQITVSGKHSVKGAGLRKAVETHQRIFWQTSENWTSQYQDNDDSVCSVEIQNHRRWIPARVSSVKSNSVTVEYYKSNDSSKLCVTTVASAANIRPVTRLMFLTVEANFETFVPLRIVNSNPMRTKAPNNDVSESEVVDYCDMTVNNIHADMFAAWSPDLMKLPNSSTMPSPQVLAGIAAEPEATLPQRRGVRNFGNTCFVNSLAQCLCATSFLGKIVSIDAVDDSRVCALQCILSCICSADAPDVTPQLIADVAGTTTSAQEDVHEFFVGLMDSIESVAVDEVREALDTMTFSGQFVTSCPQCGKESNPVTFDDRCLLLPTVVDGSTVQVSHLLGQYLEPEQLRDAERYKCPGCGVLVQASRRPTVTKCPETFILYYNRSFVSPTCPGRKETNIVRCDPNIQLTAGDELVEYELCAEIFHIGDHVAGHFCAYVADDSNEGQWTLFDDSRVETHSMYKDAEAEGRHVCFVFYRRVDAQPIQTEPAVHESLRQLCSAAAPATSESTPPSGTKRRNRHAAERRPKRAKHAAAAAQNGPLPRPPQLGGSVENDGVDSPPPLLLRRSARLRQVSSGSSEGRPTHNYKLRTTRSRS